jgi:uncharacterized protein YfiM (DUF2279 family)
LIKNWDFRFLGILALLFFASLTTAKELVAPPQDSLKLDLKLSHDKWLGKDKFDHFTASAFLVGLGYFAAHKELDRSIPASQNAAVGFSFTIGIGKELYDKYSKKGTPSYKDLLADALGCAAAFLIINAHSR